MKLNPLTAFLILQLEEDSKFYKYLWGSANHPYAGLAATQAIINNLSTEELVTLGIDGDFKKILIRLLQTNIKRVMLQHKKKVYIKDYKNIPMIYGYEFPPLSILVFGNIPENPLIKYSLYCEPFTRNNATVRGFSVAYIDKIISEWNEYVSGGREAGAAPKINPGYYIRDIVDPINDPISEDYFNPTNQMFEKYRMRAIYSLEILYKGLNNIVNTMWDKALTEFPDRYQVYSKTSIHEPPANCKKIESLEVPNNISNAVWTFYHDNNITSIVENDKKLRGYLDKGFNESSYSKVVLEKKTDEVTSSPFW